MLCDEDNYRETRWFTAWTKVRQTEDFYLPRFIRDVTGQTKVRCVMYPLVNRNYYECTVKSPTALSVTPVTVKQYDVILQ